MLEAEKMKQLLRACELELREMDLIIAVATSEEERLQEAHLPNQGRSKLIETPFALSTYEHGSPGRASSRCGTDLRPRACALAQPAPSGQR